MDATRREELKKTILSISKSSESKPRRIDRLLKEPIKSVPFFCKQIIARLKPFKVQHKTLWGDTMSFYLPEGNPIYYYGYYEADLTNFFINIVQDGDIFFDIGTHIGFYTMLAARLTAPSGSVHGFEPTPRTFKTLAENTAQFSNVFVNNVAVLDKETTLDFIDYGQRHSSFNTYKTRTGPEMKFLAKPEHIKVRAISLDAYCEEKNIRPTVIKIDAEGAEHLILRAMDKILSTSRPIVSIEVAGGAEWKENCAQSIAFLLKKGYRCFELTKEGNLKDHKQKETYLYENLIFVHPENIGKIQKFIL